MQLSTLNRVIALFLIGGFVIVMGAAAFETQIRSLLEPYSKMDLGAPAGIFLAVALLSVTALAGSIVDALGNLTVRSWIRRWFAKQRSYARVFFCGREFDAQDRWRKLFSESLERDARYTRLAQDDMIKSASAALFFRTAEKEHMEWLVQHHSMYHLSANFVIILVAFSAMSFLKQSYFLGLVSVIGAYLLTTFALDIYLYTYQMSFRNAFFALNEPGATTAAASERPTGQHVVSLGTPSSDARLAPTVPRTP